MAHEFSYLRRVEFAETDAAGVVHFAVFFRYMEEAEHAFYRSLGGAAYRREPEGVYGMPRVRASCEYLRPLRYGDRVEVRLTVREKTGRSIAYDVSFRRVEGGEPVARGAMKVVHVLQPAGSPDWRAVELPPPLREGVEPATPEAGPPDGG